MASMYGYDGEVRLIEADIAETDATAFALPIDPQRLTRHVYRRYQKASIAGDLRELSAVALVIEQALRLLGNPGDLSLLKAHAAFKLHRLADVEAALLAVPSVYDSAEGRLIRADLTFQHGRYRPAVRGYL